jgi:hypothetical protein
MRRASFWILIGLAGCVDLKAAYPDRRFYMIDAGRTGTERGGDEKTVLRVRCLAASKMCDRSEIVSRTGETTYDTDFYNVLFVPPAPQVGELTERWLRGSGLYGSVIGSGSSLIETHVLEGNLIALYGDYRKPEDVLAVIEIQFMLLRVSSDPVVVMLQKTYREGIPLAKGDPASLVTGWGKGLRKILTALEEDMAKPPPEAR